MRWQPIGHVLDGPKLYEKAQAGDRRASTPVFGPATSAHSVDASSKSYHEWWNKGMPSSGVVGHDGRQIPALGGTPLPPEGEAAE